MTRFHHYPVAFALIAIASAATAAPAPAPTNLSVEHNSYSGGRGTRSIATADTVLGMAEDTKLILSFSGGERRVGGERTRALRAGASLQHNWTSRLSTQSSVALATNGRIFARNQFAQDISYKLGDSVVATVGGKLASYAGGDRVTTWSAGAAYYMRGLSASYRYSLLDSRLLGGSHAHLASLRIKDPGGSANTQLWLGRGTSLYDLNLPTAGRGNFTAVSVRREQPVAGPMAVTFGLNRTWFHTPTGNYRGTGVSLGFSVTKLKL